VTIAGKLFVAAAAVCVVGAIGFAWIYAIQGLEGRTALQQEVAKGLIQLFTVAVIGALLQLLLSQFQEARQRDQAFRAFCDDKLRRLVEVNNTLRRAPILLDAHRSAKTYNDVMRSLIDAALHLRVIRHEMAASPGAELADAVQGIRRMESYLEAFQRDFRVNSKRVSELQGEAEKDRQLQGKVWKEIQAIPTVQSLLLEESDFENYIGHYNAVVGSLIRISLEGAKKDI
jgi:hypothetical protein